MPVTHDPHYLENALDVLLRCKQVVNDMEYHVCVELVKAWDFALANGARQQLNLDQTIQLAVVRWKTRSILNMRVYGLTLTIGIYREQQFHLPYPELDSEFDQRLVRLPVQGSLYWAEDQDPLLGGQSTWRDIVVEVKTCLQPGPPWPYKSGSAALALRGRPETHAQRPVKPFVSLFRHRLGSLPTPPSPPHQHQHQHQQ